MSSTSAEQRSTCPVRRACSRASDVSLALAELREQLDPKALDTTLVFFSANFQARAVEEGLAQHWKDRTVFGCSSAGEIGPDGYVQGSVVGLSLDHDAFDVEPVLFDDLFSFRVGQAMGMVEQGLEQLAHRRGALDPENSFALLLIDGLSLREELVTFTIADRLGDLGLVGASAADAFRFERTYVLSDGMLRTNCGLCMLVHSKVPFRLFRSQNFVASEDRVVITAADPGKRLLIEMDGAPAAERYAELVGVSVRELDTIVFAHNPLMMRVGGDWFVRSVQNVKRGGILSTFCAIDEGIVLRPGHRGPLLETLGQQLDSIEAELGGSSCVLCFDCAERRVQLEAADDLDQASKLARDRALVGFNCFGEQWGALHVNQTMTGVQFG